MPYGGETTSKSGHWLDAELDYPAQGVADSRTRHKRIAGWNILLSEN